MAVSPPNTKKALIKRLQSSRNKLTPIVNDVIVSTVDVVQKGDGKIFSDRFLTMKQYEDLIHATSILKEAEYKLSFDPRFHKLPNTDINVYGMSKSKRQSEEKGILIDEKTIISLLDIYEKIGELIEHLSDENPPLPERKGVEDVMPPKQRQGILYSSNLKEQKSGSQNSNDLKERKNSSRYSSAHSAHSSDVKDQKKSSSRITIITIDKEVETSDTQVVPPAKSVSLVNWESTPSSPNLEMTPKNVPPNVSSKPAHVSSKKLIENDSKNFKIKIMCNVSGSELDDENIQNLPPSKSKDDCFRVKLGDKPVSVKTGCEDYYCIDAQTEDEEQEIRIIIKPCSNCHGTEEKGEDEKLEKVKSVKSTHSVNGIKSKSVVIDEEKDEQKFEESTHDIKSIRSRKSKSGVEIQGEEEPALIQDEEAEDEKAEDEKAEELADEETKEERCDGCSPQIITINIGSCCGKSSNCGCAERKKPKMDLILDVDNVDQSSFKIYDERQEIEPEKKKLKLSRERTCSSQELDVTKVKTRLRNQEIEHKNSTIADELKKLGVDQILRACRPAKCCRKAILNERQRTALPYCVSLRSLPLVSEDIEVIKQSIEMSVKKIKNSMNLAENPKDKSDPFEANLNFPWVLPIYRVTLDYDRFKSEDRFYMLKKIEAKKKDLKGVIVPVFEPRKKQELEEKTKFYILKKCSKPEWTVKNKIAYKIVKPRRNYSQRKIWRSSVFEKVTRNEVFFQETTSFEDVVFAKSSTIRSSLGFMRDPLMFKI